MCQDNLELDDFIPYAVMDDEGKTVYSVEDDGRTLVFDVVESVLLDSMEAGGLTDAIIWFIGGHSPECFGAIDCIILKSDRSAKEPFVIDTLRLLKSFPNLHRILYGDAFRLLNAEEGVDTLDAFLLGELIFALTREGDIEAANALWRDLYRLDYEWAGVFREVVEDYCRKPEEHIPELDENGTVQGGGMDYLFRIYFFGWFDNLYTFDKKDGFIADKHKNVEKAIEMIPLRFKNCYPHEIGERLFWDTEHFAGETNPDYDSFRRVLLEAEKHFPGAIGGFLRMLGYYGIHLNDAFLEKIGDLLNIS